MKCYKIRHIPTGEFVVGTTYARNKLGKIWNKLNHVKAHIKPYSRNKPYKDGDYELVEYEMKEISSTLI
jgi:hypothetical protein